jgi:hypothetical protein
MKWNKMEKPNAGAPVRKVGQGAWNPSASLADRQKRFIGFITSMQGMPTYNVPTIDSVTLHYGGPLTDAQVQGSFGTTINPLGASQESPPPGCLQVDTTFAEPGKFQTFALICAIQFRVDIEPLSFTQKINSWTTPTVGSAKPVSPDMFNVADTAIATGTLGLGGAQVMVPADLEWGWWQGEAAFHMFRGYDLQWQYGHNFNLLNDTLRYTAFMGGGNTDSAASSSQVDINYYLRQTNDYYRSQFNSSQIGLSIDRARLGNMTLPVGEGAIAGQSVYRPSRAYELVGATYNGLGARNAVRGNGEFRRLSAPFLAWPGVPIGLKAQVSAQSDQLQMQNYLSASCGFGAGVIPATFTEDTNVNIGAGIANIVAGVTGMEPSLDTPIAPQFQQLLAQRTIYKGGGFKITMAFKGFELTPDQAAMVQSVDFQSVLKSECGCGLGPAGAAA